LPNFSKGIQAEKVALTFLEKKGYVLLDKNIRAANSEVDLIVIDQRYDEIVFVEVKYRERREHGEGSQAVDQRKLNSMVRVANSYLRKKQFKKSYRFDIISIVGNLDQPKFDHFENITWT